MGNTYYVEFGNRGNNEMHLHATREQALRGLDSTRIDSGNNGIISGTPPTINLAAGHRDQGKFGSNSESPILIYEATDAHAFGADNYNSDSNVSRFQSGAITFENLLWRSTLPNQDRSDFDIAPAARPTFIDCRLECLQQYSHFASPNLNLIRTTFDSNFYSNDQGQRVLDIAAKIPVPDGFTLQPRGNDLRVLGVFLEDVTETNPLSKFLRLDDLTGIRNIEMSNFNPNGANLTPTQIALKGIALYNPAGVIGRVNGNGSQVIYRSIHLDSGGEEILDSTQTIVDTTEAGHADPNTKTATGTASLDFDVLSHSAISQQSYTEHDTYEALHTSLIYRKKLLRFTIDKSPSAAGTIQNFGLELVREQYPNGVDFAPSDTAPTSATDLEKLYELCKRYEVPNPEAFARDQSIAIIEEGYIRFADGISVVLDRQATAPFAFDDGNDTVTIKTGNSIGTGSNDLLGIRVGGNGTISSPAGQTLPSGILYLTATGGNAVVSITQLDPEAKTALFTSTGALVGSVITGTTTATINVSQAEASAGMVLVTYRRGFIEQSIPLDLSAGGSITRNFEALYELRDFDGRSTFYADRLSTLSRFVFGQETVQRGTPPAAVTRPTMVAEVGNEQWSLRSFSSTMFNALWSEDGLRYLSRGGRAVEFGTFAGYLGAEMVFPPGVKLRRRDRSDSSATVLSTIFIREGEPLVDESNGQVIINGVRDRDSLADALWNGRVDVPGAQAGSALFTLRGMDAVLTGDSDVNGSAITFKDSAGVAAVRKEVRPTGERRPVG